MALQLPDSEGGGRLTDKFTSDQSIWQILRKFEEGVAGGQSKKLNFTERGVPSTGASSGAGRLEYDQPCLHIVGRNLETFADLQKTLAQLGFNGGSVAMRLSFKSSRQPLEEAMKEIGQYFSAVTQPRVAESSSSATQSAEETHVDAPSKLESPPNADADNAALPTEATGPKTVEPEDSPMPDAPPAEPVQNDVNASPSIASPSDTIENSKPVSPSEETINGMSVYRPPSNSTPAAALHEEDPATFEPHIDHAKAHQAALQRASRNTRLLSDKELEEQEAARQEKLASVSQVKIRVRYPDLHSIELTCPATETSADLYAKVMGTLRHAPEPFELRYTGNKGFQTLPNNSNQKLVRDFGFKGSVLVTLVWSPEASIKTRQGPILKDEYLTHAQDLKVELASQQATGQANHRAAMKQPDKPAPGAAKGNIEDKMKKFLGFGKKK